jgi:CRISPR system Cascade subunit CasE
MYLSQATLTAAAIARRPVQGMLARGMYGHHQLLCALFSGGHEGRFLFRHLDDERGLTFLTLSPFAPEPSDQGDWDIATKPFHPVLETGKRLVFSVRINPTISRSSGPRDGDGTRRRGQRRDLIYEAVRARRESDGQTPDRREIAQMCGEAWLGIRLEKAGFVIDGRDQQDVQRGLSVACTGYRQHHVRKGTGEITVSTLDCQGVGTVSDPSAFAELLKNGLGAAKGFGCGLVLIKPA